MESRKEMIEALFAGEQLEHTHNKTILKFEDDLFIFDPLIGTQELNYFYPKNWHIKQKMLSINGFEYPEPLKECADQVDYWVIDLLNGKVRKIRSPYVTKAWFENGFVQATEEGAKQQLIAYQSLVGKKS